MLARCHEICKTLELVAGHCTIAPSFQGKVLLEMCVKMLFKSDVAYETHPADTAVKLNALKDFCLGCLSRPKRQEIRFRTFYFQAYYLLIFQEFFGEGRAVRLVL